MTGKIVRVILGLILVVVAILLFISAKMPWTGVLALIVAVICFIGAFGGKKKEEKKGETVVPLQPQPKEEEPKTE